MCLPRSKVKNFNYVLKWKSTTRMYTDTQLSQSCKHIWAKTGRKKGQLLTVVIFMCKDFECVFYVLLTL